METVVHFAVRAVKGGWALHRDSEPVGEFAALASAREAVEALRAAAGLCERQTFLIVEFEARTPFVEPRTSRDQPDV